MDDEEANHRVTPHWPTYRDTFLSLGFRLDTVRDVKDFYNAGNRSTDSCETSIPGYLHAFACDDDDALCPDPGLVSVTE